MMIDADESVRPPASQVRRFHTFATVVIRAKLGEMRTRHYGGGRLPAAAASRYSRAQNLDNAEAG